ncbi:MAG: acyl carrier protein [Ruminococcaceae bacterium]|nr:acyl carrier protein [Oscillospiraceae bacterium]
MVYQALCKSLASQLDVSEQDIRPDTNIIDDLGADSLDIVELISAMEDEFDIIITDEHIRELYTVQEIADFLESKINK